VISIEDQRATARLEIPIPGGVEVSNWSAGGINKLLIRGRGTTPEEAEAKLRAFVDQIAGSVRS
jgi:hypothetical protein